MGRIRPTASQRVNVRGKSIDATLFLPNLTTGPEPAVSPFVGQTSTNDKNCPVIGSRRCLIYIRICIYIYIYIGIFMPNTIIRGWCRETTC